MNSFIIGVLGLSAAVLLCGVTVFLWAIVAIVTIDRRRWRG